MGGPDRFGSFAATAALNLVSAAQLFGQSALATFLVFPSIAVVEAPVGRKA